MRGPKPVSISPRTRARRPTAISARIPDCGEHSQIAAQNHDREIFSASFRQNSDRSRRALSPTERFAFDDCHSLAPQQRVPALGRRIDRTQALRRDQRPRAAVPRRRLGGEIGRCAHGRGRRIGPEAGEPFLEQQQPRQKPAAPRALALSGKKARGERVPSDRAPLRTGRRKRRGPRASPRSRLRAAPRNSGKSAGGNSSPASAARRRRRAGASKSSSTAATVAGVALSSEQSPASGTAGAARTQTRGARENASSADAPAICAGPRALIG